MSLTAGILLAQEIIGLIGPLMALGVNVSGLVQRTRQVLDADAAPGDEAWDALDAQIKSLQARLNADPA